MCAFCEWAADHGVHGNQEADKLAKTVKEGLARLGELLG